MPSNETTGWLMVLTAGLLEVAWPICMKQSQGFTRIGWIAAMMLVMCASFGLLSLAVSGKFHVPIGTAYAVWTGLGAAGAAAVGILLFGEPRNALRLVCLGLIIAGVIGLKFTHKDTATPTDDAPVVAADSSKDQ